MLSAMLLQFVPPSLARYELLQPFHLIRHGDPTSTFPSMTILLVTCRPWFAINCHFRQPARRGKAPWLIHIRPYQGFFLSWRAVPRTALQGGPTIHRNLTDLVQPVLPVSPPSSSVFRKDMSQLIETIICVAIYKGIVNDPTSLPRIHGSSHSGTCFPKLCSSDRCRICHECHCTLF